MCFKIKKSENQKKKFDFENSSFQFESYLFSEVKFAQTHTAGFFANFHLKPQIRTSNDDKIFEVMTGSVILFIGRITNKVELTIIPHNFSYFF